MKNLKTFEFLIKKWIISQIKRQKDTISYNVAF